MTSSTRVALRTLDHVASPAIGLLVPAPCRVMEQDFMRWLPAGGRLHVNRLNAPAQRPDDMEENLRAMTAGVEEVARLVDLAEPDVIAFGCTSGSFLKGADWEEEILERLRSAVRVPHVVLTARACVDALKALNVRRIAVATPYPEKINEQLRRYLEHFGFEIGGFEAIDAWKGGTIARFPPSVAVDLAMRAAAGGGDAVFVSCTNFRAGEAIEDMEALTGLPVVTANQATFQACLRAVATDVPSEKASIPRPRRA
jgi:maleate cis-trans isomerase